MTFALVMVALVIGILLVDRGLKQFVGLGKKKTSVEAWRPAPLVVHENICQHPYGWEAVTSPYLHDDDGNDEVVAYYCSTCSLVLTPEEHAQKMEMKVHVDTFVRPYHRSVVRPGASSTPPRPPTRKDEVVGGIAPLFEDEVHYCAGKDRCDTCDRPVWGDTEFTETHHLNQ